MNKPALIRVLLAFSLVFSFTFIAHEVRSNGSSSANFPDRLISSDEKLIEIDIAPGSTGSAIAKQLFSAGIIESSQSFFKLAIADSRASRIAPGIHLLNVKISGFLTPASNIILY